MLATHTRIMRALTATGPTTLSALATHLNTTTTNVSRSLFEMRELGYVVSDGKRGQYIYSINPSYTPEVEPERERPPNSIWEVATRSAQ